MRGLENQRVCDYLTTINNFDSDRGTERFRAVGRGPDCIRGLVMKPNWLPTIGNLSQKSGVVCATIIAFDGDGCRGVNLQKKVGA